MSEIWICWTKLFPEELENKVETLNNAQVRSDEHNTPQVEKKA